MQESFERTIVFAGDKETLKRRFWSAIAANSLFCRWPKASIAMEIIIIYNSLTTAFTEQRIFNSAAITVVRSEQLEWFFKD